MCADLSLWAGREQAELCLSWISGHLQSGLQSPSDLPSTAVTAGYLGTAQDSERTLLTASGCFPHP